MKASPLRFVVAICLLIGSCWFGLQNSAEKLPWSTRNYLRASKGDLSNTPSRILGGTDDHATDDHATDDHGSGHPSLFKALSVIHVERGTASIFIIIAFIVFLKQLITALYAITMDTPFYEMIGKIEEELMIVGTSSFLFKVILNTTNFDTNEWAYPLEFAETLVPILAFSYCGLGVIVVLISLKQCYSWNRAHNLKTLEILDDYFEATQSLYFK